MLEWHLFLTHGVVLSWPTFTATLPQDISLHVHEEERLYGANRVWGEMSSAGRFAPRPWGETSMGRTVRGAKSL